jgi:hypothetical protein
VTIESSPFKLEFYGRTDNSDGPVMRWIKKELTALQRRSLGVALHELLEAQGVGVCKTGYGRQLSGGIFEFRLDQSAEEVLRYRGKLPDDMEPAEHDPILLRVFCHAYGNQIVLLLHGYDKGRNPSGDNQNRQIEVARDRLKKWLSDQKAANKAQRKA